MYGKDLGFEQFLQHLRTQKAAIKTMLFHFKTVVEEGDVVFSNHIASGETNEGREGEVQVMAEFQIRDGKIVSCDELTHMISGDQRDRDLGSRH